MGEDRRYPQYPCEQEYEYRQGWESAEGDLRRERYRQEERDQERLREQMEERRRFDEEQEEDELRNIMESSQEIAPHTPTDDIPFWN